MEEGDIDKVLLSYLRKFLKDFGQYNKILEKRNPIAIVSRPRLSREEKTTIIAHFFSEHKRVREEFEAKVLGMNRIDEEACMANCDLILSKARKVRNYLRRASYAWSGTEPHWPENWSELGPKWKKLDLKSFSEYLGRSLGIYFGVIQYPVVRFPLWTDEVNKISRLSFIEQSTIWAIWDIYDVEPQANYRPIFNALLYIVKQRRGEIDEALFKLLVKEIDESFRLRHSKLNRKW